MDGILLAQNEGGKRVIKKTEFIWNPWKQNNHVSGVYFYLSNKYLDEIDISLKWSYVEHVRWNHVLLLDVIWLHVYLMFVDHNSSKGSFIRKQIDVLNY